MNAREMFSVANTGRNTKARVIREMTFAFIVILSLLLYAVSIPG